MSVGHFQRVLWRFIKPEIEEIIVYTAFVVLFGAIAFYQTIIKHTTERTSDISLGFSLIQEKLQFITNGDETAAKIFTFGTWFIIGTIVYMIAWFLISFGSGAFKDIEVSSSYVHPRSFHKSDFWFSILTRVVLQVCAAVSFIIYASVWVTAFAPAWLASYKEIFIQGVTGNSVYNLVLSLIGIAVSLHIGAILLRVVLLRSKYFYQR